MNKKRRKEFFLTMPKKEKVDKEKFTIYIRKELSEAGQDLARISRLSWPEYIEKLIERDIEANSEKIRKFRELSDDSEAGTLH